MRPIALLLLYLAISNCFLDRNTDKSGIIFRNQIQLLLETHEDERSEILATGEWKEIGTWGSITQLATSAYHIALVAIDAIHAGESATTEFRTLTEGLVWLCPWMRSKNFTVLETQTTLSINFTRQELFENGTMESTPKSLRYLPIMGALFNNNSHSHHLLGKLVQACQVYDPVAIVKDVAYSMKIPKPEEPLSQAGITTEMIRLEALATDKKFSCYAMILMYAECLALSQKPFLRERETKPISPALPHFTAALNLLQKKFKRTAELLQPRHAEL